MLSGVVCYHSDVFGFILFLIIPTTYPFLIIPNIHFYHDQVIIATLRSCPSVPDPIRGHCCESELVIGLLFCFTVGFISNFCSLSEFAAALTP